MSPPLPVDHHIFIPNNSNNKLDSGRIDRLLGLASRSASAPARFSLSPASHIKHDYEQQKQPSLTLSLLFPATTQQQQNLSSRDNKCDYMSSFSNSLVSVERKREDLEEGATANNDIDGTSCRKKKLRLNKQQSALLEDSFKLHATLNPKQKEALARKLNLRPRQVEVWFQNRRARTKLKQTQVDCDFLKKCCERLAEENENLHKELQHLKSLNKQQPFYLHHLPLPPTRLSMCPSCYHSRQGLPPDNNNNHTNASFLTSSENSSFLIPSPRLVD